MLTTYDRYLRQMRAKKLEGRVVDNRGSVRWPEVWTTQKDLAMKQRAAIKNTLRGMEGM